MIEVPRIKVCGLTLAEDVHGAVEAGADAVGFVHHAPSPRHLDPARAAQLASLLPSRVASVAVVVDAGAEDMHDLLVATGIGWVQLCGSEQVEDWRDFSAPILRRIGVGPGAEVELARWEGVAAAFVLDHPDSPGGSGRAVDLEHAASLAERAPCLLAGGLGPGNVAERIRVVRPRGVDASSRLEAGPGRKDSAAVTEFVRAARAAFEEPSDD